jgi:hypothetical protein
MRAIRLAVLAVLIAWPAFASAGHKAVVVDAGSLHEECLSMAPGQALRYEFQSDRALAFNIHYHEGDAVHYPVRHPATAALSGGFEPDERRRRHYCMMWANDGPAPAALRYDFQLEGAP